MSFFARRFFHSTRATFVKVAEKFPVVQVHDSIKTTVSTQDLVNKGKVIVFGVPGAFSTYPTTLRVENFKRFKSIEIPLESFPLIICGPNSSGKTQLLWALVLFFRGFNLRNEKSQHKEKKFFKLDTIYLLLNQPNFQRLTTFTSFVNKIIGQEVQKNGYKYEGEAVFTAALNDNSEIKANLYSNGEIGFHELSRSYFKDKIYFAFMGTSIHFLPELKEGRASDVLTSGNPDFRSRYLDLPQASQEKVIDLLKELFMIQSLKKVADKKDRSLIVTEGNGVELEIMFTSHSFQKVFGLFVLFYSLLDLFESTLAESGTSGPKYFLIEEIESHLYPSLLSKILETLSKLSQEHDVKLILTSLSDQVISWGKVKLPLSSSIAGTIEEEVMLKEIGSNIQSTKPLLLVDGSDETKENGFINVVFKMMQRDNPFQVVACKGVPGKDFLRDFVQPKIEGKAVVYLKDPEFLPFEFVKNNKSGNVHTIYWKLPCIESYIILNDLLQSTKEDGSRKLDEYFGKFDHWKSYQNGLIKALELVKKSPTADYWNEAKKLVEESKKRDLTFEEWLKIVRVIRGHDWVKSIMGATNTKSLLGQIAFGDEVKGLLKQTIEEIVSVLK